MVQREETRKVVMGSYTAENSEAKAFVTTTRPDLNSRTEVREDQTVKCKRCKIKGTKKKCWFLHPHLRPKGQRRGGDCKQGKKPGGGNKGKNRGYVAEIKEAEWENNSGNKGDAGSSRDETKHLLQQLTSGIVINLSLSSKQTIWF